ncbi:MAG: hypothetical protein ACT6FE_08080, partial [Methanosarcinaceae archaeon]
MAIIIYNLDYSNPEQDAIEFASWDLDRCLNYAGMAALKWKGEHPIIQPEGTPIEKSTKDGFVVTTDIHDVEPGGTLHITLDRPVNPWYDFTHSFANNITVTIYDSHNILLATFSPSNEISTKKSIEIPQGAKPGFGRIE